MVNLAGRDDTNLRFARGSATTNGTASALQVTIKSYFGKRSGAVSVIGRDEDTLAQAVGALRGDRAGGAGKSRGILPPLGPQQYAAGTGYDAATAAIRAADLAAGSKRVIDAAARRALDVTGYSIAGPSFEAMATSAGLFAYDPHTSAEFTVTARNRAGTWSGWAGVAETRIGGIDTTRLGARALDKAAYTAPPIRLDPGRYTVILEPSAVSDLVNYLLWSMGGRPADEGRSFFSQKGGGNKIGEKLFADSVTIYFQLERSGDAGADLRPRRPAAGPHRLGRERRAHEPRLFALLGAVQDRSPVPTTRSFVMAGGTTSAEDMIRDVKRGVLITRLWYIRILDAQKLVLTGLTRDGNFLIENGRIAGPALNFRFNESPIAILAKVLAVGPSERTRGGESERPNDRDADGAGEGFHVLVDVRRDLSAQGGNLGFSELRAQRRRRIDAEDGQLLGEERELLEREHQARFVGVALDVGVELRGEEVAADHVAFELGHVDAVGGEAAHRLVERGRHVAHAEHESRDGLPLPRGAHFLSRESTTNRVVEFASSSTFSFRILRP